MLPTLALVVFCTAIIVSFSQEFGRFFKKLFAIRGVTLLLPLTLTTIIILLYEPWVIWGLFQFKMFLHRTVSLLEALLPFKKGASLLASVFIIMLLTIGPLLIINEWIKRKSYREFNHGIFLSAMIGLFLIILFSVNLNF